MNIPIIAIVEVFVCNILHLGPSVISSKVSKEILYLKPRHTPLHFLQNETATTASKNSPISRQRAISFTLWCKGKEKIRDENEVL